MASGSAWGQSLSQSVQFALTGNCSDIGPHRGPQLAALCAAVPVSFGVDAPGGDPSGPSDQSGEDQQDSTKKRLDYLRAERAGDPTAPLTLYAQGTSSSMSDASDHSGVFDFGQLSGFFNFQYENVSKRQTYFTNGYDSNQYGGTFGVDHTFTNNAVLGLSLTYNHTDADFNSGGGNFNLDSYGGTIYGSVSPSDNWFFDGSIGFMHNDIQINRNVAFSNLGNTFTVRGTASGAPQSDEYRASVNGGYDFYAGNITYGPRFGFAYSDNEVNAFSESGTTGLELAFGRQTYQSLTSSVGGKVSMAISTSFGVIVPQLQADYIHEFDEDQQTLYAHFVQDYNGSPDQLVFQTDEPHRDYFGLGIGAVLGLPHGLSSFVNYRALVGDTLKTTQTVTAGLRMEF